MTTPTDAQPTPRLPNSSTPRRSHSPLALVVVLAGVVVVTAGVVVVSGIFASKDQPAPAAASTPSPAAVPVLHPDDVIARLRNQGEFTVTGVHPLDGDRLFVAEGLEVTITDPFDHTSSTAVIATFGNADGRTAYQMSLLALGGAIAVGTGDRPQDLWGVNLWGPKKPADGPALADKIARRLGGTIRPVPASS